jgi:transposase
MDANKELKKMNEMTIVVDLEEQNNNMVVAMKPKKRGPGRPRKVSDDIFMEVFNKAGSLKEAAQLLGLPVNSVSVKASNLRKTGCNVKRFRRGRKKKVAR